MGKKIIWARDDAYSCEYTARRGDFAAVIVPPEVTGEDGWGYQIFDEADEDAMDHGEWYTEAHGITSRDAARRIAETILKELARGRK